MEHRPHSLERRQSPTAALELTGGGEAVLSATADKVLRVNSLSVDAAGGSKLDLGNNDAIIDYSATSPLTSIRNWIATGRNGGNWLGAGIISSSAASDPHTALGLGEAPTLGLSSFSGQSVDSSTVLVKYTYYGDANLDGQVDISDLGRLATAWQTSGSWVNGDFDYSGFIDISDLGLLATNWQAGVGNPLAPSFDQALAAVGLGGVVVPEPAAATLMVLAISFLLSQRTAIPFLRAARRRELRRYYLSDPPNS